MHVFTKKDGDVRHFWASEMEGNHVDLVWAYWNLMDMTPEGPPGRRDTAAELPARSSSRRTTCSENERARSSQER